MNANSVLVIFSIQLEALDIKLNNNKFSNNILINTLHCTYAEKSCFQSDGTICGINYIKQNHITLNSRVELLEPEKPRTISIILL